MRSSKGLELEIRKVYDMAHGLSTGVCLPKHYARNLGIKSGDFVKISQVDQRIVIEKVQHTWKLKIEYAMPLIVGMKRRNKSK